MCLIIFSAIIANIYGSKYKYLHCQVEIKYILQNIIPNYYYFVIGYKERHIYIINLKR